MARALFVLTVGALFAGCATDDPGRPLTDVEQRTTVAAPRSIPVCELVGRDSILQVHATDAGTRYTLCSIQGVPLARDLDAAELAKLRPDLDPDTMQADWGKGPLMLLDVRE